MLGLLEQYKQQAPEIIFEWNDRLSEARGWVVINSLRNGAAGGGTRMRKGLTQEEVLSLAKVMEIKFTVSGPPIGGAKSGIDFDPNDPRKNEVLQRWYKAVFPLLKNYYGTGGDLNIDEIKDVIPITEDLGLWHPQEGVVSGFMKLTKGKRIHSIGQLRYGCAKIVENPLYVPSNGQKYAIADMITGYGVAESVKHYFDIFQGENIKNKTVIIQGWGNVAATAGYYLSRQGAKIVGIIDRNHGIIREEGLSEDELLTVFTNKKNNQLQGANLLSFDEVNNAIWDVPADIFIPAAASKLITNDQISRLINAGLKLISCGANVPFMDDKIFFGQTATEVDQKISLIPDFIANCGMARVFAYLMGADIVTSDEAIFGDVSRTIKNALTKLHKASNSSLNLSAKALKIALQTLEVSELV